MIVDSVQTDSWLVSDDCWHCAYWQLTGGWCLVRLYWRLSSVLIDSWVISAVVWLYCWLTVHFRLVCTTVQYGRTLSLCARQQNASNRQPWSFKLFIVMSKLRYWSGYLVRNEMKYNWLQLQTFHVRSCLRQLLSPFTSSGYPVSWHHDRHLCEQRLG